MALRWFARAPAITRVIVIVMDSVGIGSRLVSNNSLGTMAKLAIATSSSRVTSNRYTITLIAISMIVTY